MYFQILVMKDGEVQYQGRLSEVKKVNPELYESWRIALKEAKVAEAARSVFVNKSALFVFWSAFFVCWSALFIGKLA